jgi:hypothetical protein
MCPPRGLRVAEDFTGWMRLSASGHGEDTPPTRAGGAAFLGAPRHGLTVRHRSGPPLPMSPTNLTICWISPEP